MLIYIPQYSQISVTNQLQKRGNKMSEAVIIQILLVLIVFILWSINKNVCVLIENINKFLIKDLQSINRKLPKNKNEI